MIGAGGVLGFAVWFVISSDKRWLQITCLTYVVGVNVLSIIESVRKENWIYAGLTIAGTLILFGIFHRLNQWRTTPGI